MLYFPGSSTSLALLYTVTAFFASAAWTLLMAKCFCQKISSTITKLNLIAIAVAVFAGALFASAVILKVRIFLFVFSLVFFT